MNYSNLKNIYHEEKKAMSLSKINDTFYADVQELLSKIEDLHKEHIIKIFHEIYNMRENKIMENAARSHKPENLIPLENELYDEITGTLEKFKNMALYLDLAEPIMDVKAEKSLITSLEIKETPKSLKPETGKIPEIPEKEKKIKIRILSNFPAIIGSDMKHYKLNENDEVELPGIDAKILVVNGIAIRV